MIQPVEKCGKVGALWERHGPAPRTDPPPGWLACSACAGDYEDPDRTAPPDPDEDDELSEGDEWAADDPEACQGGNHDSAETTRET